MALKARRLSNVFLWILMGLLLVGLAGFGATNLSGTARSVAQVGDQDVGVDAYARAVQQRLRQVQQEAGQPVTLADLRDAGVDRQILAQLVTAAGFDWEAERIGLSVGDADLADQIREISAFQGPDGTFNREAYRFALDNAGLSEAEFEEDLRNEAARNILQGAVLAGTQMPDIYAARLVEYAGETRSFTWALLEQGEFDTGQPVPTEEELQAYYDENIGRYTRPETREITYAWLTPDMLLDTVEVSDEALRAAYEEREAEFNMPERRLAERLVFEDEDAAQAAYDRIAAGDTSFDALVEERGLTLSDVDQGIVDAGDLGGATETVFATPAGQVSEPVQTSLGPALYRVNATLAAQETPFEEARATLRSSLALNRAREVIEEMATDLDDRLAGGATLEDLASETEMELGTIAFTGASEDGIADYPAFTEAARAAEVGDYPEIAETGDGGLFALRLNEVLEPAPRPFEEVRDQVETGWETRAATDALMERAETLAEEIASGTSFEDAGLEPNSVEAFTRSDSVDPLPPGHPQTIFELEAGAVETLRAPGRVAILRLDEITPADTGSEESLALAERLRREASAAMADDLLNALSADIQTRAGVSVNQDALNAVNSNLQ